MSPTGAGTSNCWRDLRHGELGAYDLLMQGLLRNVLAGSPLLPARARRGILRACGIGLGENAWVAPHTTFKGTNVSIGPGSFMNQDCYVDRGRLTLGTNVFVGPGVVFATNNHEISSRTQRAGANVEQPIIVGDGTWIGARAVILGNVHVAPGCVVAAGAVVTKNTDPDGLYAGVPAVRVRDL